MGDEFDPSSSEWAVLLHRWQIMTTIIEPATGVAPYTNQLPFPAALAQAVTDLGNRALSFDSYDEATSVEFTRTYAPKVASLTVAVNALAYSTSVELSATTIVDHMRAVIAAGADRILVFGGGYPYLADLSPDPAFGGQSLVTPAGGPTALAGAVLTGANG
jgi:hypothetical protein